MRFLEIALDTADEARLYTARKEDNMESTKLDVYASYLFSKLLQTVYEELPEEDIPEMELLKKLAVGRPPEH